MTHHVFLVPGFFGFQNLGKLHYFARCAEHIATRLSGLGVDAEVRAVGTLPTASLGSRAARLAETIARTAGDEGPIHLVGHSSGGLDVRLLVTPSMSLATDVDVAGVVGRIASVVTVATPHCGTPLASAVTGVLGQRLLRTLSMATIGALRVGSRPLQGVLRAGQILLRLDDLVGVRGTILDQLYAQVLADFSDEHSQSLEAFLGHVRGDQALLPQLSPESMGLLAASIPDPDGVRFGSVVTRARPPRMLSAFAVGLDPIAQLTHGLYHAAYRLTAQWSGDPPPLTVGQTEALISGYGEIPTAQQNDGMVPTRSQIWGDVVHIARADHLDVMGYYGDAAASVQQTDWLPTHSGFDRQAFTALWGAVARYIAASVRP